MRAFLMTLRRVCRQWMQRRADRRIVRARLRKIEEQTRAFEAGKVLAQIVPRIAA